MSGDSRPDTYAHIRNVQRLGLRAIQNLERRLLRHDASKLEEPELSIFNEMESELRSHAYNTEGYWETLRRMKPAIDHHYEHNSHHPEHYADGVRGMSLLDLIEMLCDWQAAALRRPNPMDIRESIEVNQKRFGYDDDLKGILLATADELSL